MGTKDIIEMERKHNELHWYRIQHGVWKWEVASISLCELWDAHTEKTNCSIKLVYAIRYNSIERHKFSVYRLNICMTKRKHQIYNVICTWNWDDFVFCVWHMPHRVWTKKSYPNMHQWYHDWKWDRKQWRHLALQYNVSFNHSRPIFFMGNLFPLSPFPPLFPFTFTST